MVWSKAGGGRFSGKKEKSIPGPGSSGIQDWLLTSHTFILNHQFCCRYSFGTLDYNPKNQNFIWQNCSLIIKMQNYPIFFTATTSFSIIFPFFHFSCTFSFVLVHLVSFTNIMSYNRSHSFLFVHLLSPFHLPSKLCRFYICCSNIKNRWTRWMKVNEKKHRWKIDWKWSYLKKYMKEKEWRTMKIWLGMIIYEHISFSKFEFFTHRHLDVNYCGCSVRLHLGKTQYQLRRGPLALTKKWQDWRSVT